MWGLLGILVLLWLATGIYIVAPDEKGVVLRFGEWVATTDPGPHYHLPAPIETVYKPKVTEVKRIEVGFRSAPSTWARRPATAMLRPRASC